MKERLFGVQIGGVWASVQVLLMALAVLALLWILSKIELDNGGESSIEKERGKK